MAGKEPEALRMKRDIGLVGGVAIIVGSMIGSGIFISPQFVQANVGSPGASMVIWTLSGVLTMFAALSYAEIGTIFPESGGDFIYLLRIYGPCPAFFAAFSVIVVVRPAGIAAMSLIFAEYAITPFYPDCSPPQAVVKCAAAVAVVFVATVNILNVQLAIKIQVVFMVVKVLTLTAIIIGGMVEVIQSSDVLEENLKVENAFKDTRYSVSALGMAFFQGLWSFSGWNNLNCVTGELKRPEVRLKDVRLHVYMMFEGMKRSIGQQQGGGIGMKKHRIQMNGRGFIIHDGDCLTNRFKIIFSICDFQSSIPTAINSSYLKCINLPKMM